MTNAIEITIRLKNEESTLNKHHLSYELISLQDNDEVLAPLIQEALKEFKGEPDDVVVKCKMVVK